MSSPTNPSPEDTRHSDNQDAPVMAAVSNASRPPAGKRAILGIGLAIVLIAIAAAVALTVHGRDNATSSANTNDYSPAAGKDMQGNDKGQTGTQSGAIPGGSAGSSDGGQSQQNAGNTSSPTATPPASAVNTTPNAATTVAITGSGFSPASLTVAANTTVTWKNDDSAAHAIDKADGDTGPHSPQLSPGATYSFSFSKPGTYKYVDVLKPSASGIIVVK